MVQEKKLYFSFLFSNLLQSLFSGHLISLRSLPGPIASCPLTFYRWDKKSHKIAVTHYAQGHRARQRLALIQVDDALSALYRLTIKSMLALAHSDRLQGRKFQSLFDDKISHALPAYFSI